MTDTDTEDCSRTLHTYSDPITSARVAELHELGRELYAPSPIPKQRRQVLWVRQVLLKQPLPRSAQLDHELRRFTHRASQRQDTLLGASCHVRGAPHAKLNFIASFSIADVVPSQRQGTLLGAF